MEVVMVKASPFIYMTILTNAAKIINEGQIICYKILIDN